MNEIEKKEDLEGFVSQLNTPEESPSVVFDNAVEQLVPTEISLLLESLPIESRCARWQQVPDEQKTSVLLGMRYQARDSILLTLDESTLDLILRSLDAESLIELSDNLTEELIEKAFGYLDSKQKSWYQGAAEFDEKHIGRYADHHIVTIPPNAKTRDAIRALKRGTTELFDQVFVVDKQGLFLGVIPVSVLLKEKDPIRMVRGMIETVSSPVLGSDPLMTAAETLEHSGEYSLPIVDNDGRLVGCITQAIALWITREHFESQFMAKVGLNESADLFVPVFKGARQRAVWLGLNLLTAFLASWTIGLFEAVLSQVVALAVLMPVVASMGGIAGSQTLTLIIRGLATKQVTFRNSWLLSKQELGIALFNGVGWAVVIGLVTWYWFDSGVIGLVIGIAVMANIMVAALSGVYIPLILDKLKFDPALSGAVVLTTVTDVVGFVTFLGLGTLLIL
ncbi:MULTISPECIES: magnesium transporter [unclassified Neptuniibacter]|jgi:magnesium transporter|uniref:magnesium transporter n=1 Tax=unclassified Neptuniibacter TaxID=2630693 RepID=UPI0026E45BE5|nr:MULTISPECIES: magnesium transporter [unclassified Neptuniibacter]MDO6513086.1 magnesium transporter [Neptuniibacter sp. 2_MG-2023]MDO6592502.1 magnesium transporter [Neptuniibacter sp. 1_MG-2023]